jgi:transposase
MSPQTQARRLACPHKNVHFHFTPTHASWLNQVECWFSILGGQSMQRASFTSVAQLRTHIDAFIDHYNQTARHFAWNKSEVHQKRLTNLVSRTSDSGY